MSAGVAVGTEAVKAAGKIYGRAPLLFSITACVFAVCAAIVAAVYLTHKPLTRADVEEILHTYPPLQQAITKDQMDASLRERDERVNPSTDRKLSEIVAKLDQLAARIEARTEVAKAESDRVLQELGSLKAADQAIQTRVDHLLELMTVKPPR